DILIGGAGADKLDGGDGDDVLIAAATVHDTEPAHLAALAAEWSRTDRLYAARVADLRSGGAGTLNGPFTLNDASLIVDNAVDTANGRGGSDLFFLNFTGLPATTRDHTDRQSS